MLKLTPVDEEYFDIKLFHMLEYTHAIDVLCDDAFLFIMKSLSSNKQ